ncbi:MAG: YggT family protein [Oscillospiraceae bacterium]|nr:YggT family protein [Oscillospiraceae bacterium]
MVILALLRTFIATLLRVYELLFIARAILSWFPMATLGGLMSFIYAVTEPVLAPIRALLMKIPALASMPIDFSVLVAFLLIDVLRTIIFYI